MMLERDEIKSFSEYPFNIDIVKNFEELRFDSPVTFFIGENSVGKSTFIEAIAVSLGLPAEDGTENFRYETQNTTSTLSDYLVMKNIYENLECEVRTVKISELKDNINKAKEYVDWADIIYEGGGATELMINLWKETGFDNILKEAYELGKVMCGISAGSICCFNSGFTDDTKLVDGIYALNLIDAYCVPHCQKEGKMDRVRKSLKYIDKVGILLSNCTAIEIIDDEYRIIKTKPIEEKFEPFAYKTYWNNGKMHEEEIDNKSFKPLNELLGKKTYNSK